MKKGIVLLVSSVVFGFLGMGAAIVFFAFGDYTGSMLTAVISMVISFALSALFFWLSIKLGNIYILMYYRYHRESIEIERKEDDRVRFNNICRQIGISPETSLYAIDCTKKEDTGNVFDASSSFIKKA